MIVVDEYLAVRVFGGDWPTGLPNDELALPASRHWRLLQALHCSRGGQLWFGIAANVGRVVERAAGELGLAVRVAYESST